MSGLGVGFYISELRGRMACRLAERANFEFAGDGLLRALGGETTLVGLMCVRGASPKLVNSEVRLVVTDLKQTEDRTQHTQTAVRS